jgi:hypothetical protein
VAVEGLDIAGSFEQWDAVPNAYSAHTLLTLPRDFPGCGDHHYTVTSGRNDFELLKVTHDSENLYLLAQTREPVSPATDPNWMWLFLDVRGDGLPDWEGFSYLVNRVPGEGGETSLEICVGGWEWRSLGTVAYRVEGNRLHLAVPRSLLRTGDGAFSIEFKWVDNTQAPGDIMDLYVNGDTAPQGRFRYRYEVR